VAAMTSIVTPTRKIYEKGEINVEAEDNAMVLLDHGDAKISCVQCGFNFFNPHGHEGKTESRHTVAIYGSRGSMGLVGYDWEPLGVDVATEAVHQVTSDDGRPTGAYDGTRLLQAADTFAYGTPTILEPTFDKQGDGTATFNEIRHVVRHFDVDTSGGFGNAEARAFEAAVGITWMPAATR